MAMDRRGSDGTEKGVCYMVVFPHLCPVCKEYGFVEPFEECPVCHWTFDVVQEHYPDAGHCGNYMSLNEAKQAYEEGKEI